MNSVLGDSFNLKKKLTNHTKEIVIHNFFFFFASDYKYFSLKFDTYILSQLWSKQFKKYSLHEKQKCQ